MPFIAAVSLTYDDSLSVQLDQAMLDLQEHGLLGTFFVCTGRPAEDSWHTRGVDWAAAAARGHEIANHTHHHPCRHPGWDTKDLADYTLQQIVQEVELCSREIAVVTGRPPVSFAYPCGNTTVGPDGAQISYEPEMARMFLASRHGGDRLVDPAADTMSRIPSFVYQPGQTLQQLVELLDTAIARGHWLVMTFHGVGGGHFVCPRQLHRAFCHEINARKAQLRCGTFAAIARTMGHPTGSV